MKKHGLLLTLFCLLFWCPLVRGQTADESDFINIEPIRFGFQYGNYHTLLELESSQARIWYGFLKADRHTDRTPIFVFFNGGPGSATSCGLMSMYTGHYTLDNSVEDGGGDHYIANPYPWTQMGHLLYIDARATGFSYNIKNNSDQFATRFLEFNAQNFNPYFDGADFIRVILRFLAAHPGLRKNPVVIVGESYGGARATNILYLIHNYMDIGNGNEMYQDPAMTAEVQGHFNAVFPEYYGRAVPREVIARQFGHQILIEPCVSMGYQDSISDAMFKEPGSVIYKIAAEVGIPYAPSQDPLTFVHDVAKRDYYIYTKPSEWLNGFFGNAANLLRFSQNISLVTGSDIRNVPGMYASQRTNAYRKIWTDSGGNAVDLFKGSEDSGGLDLERASSWRNRGSVLAGNHGSGSHDLFGKVSDYLFMDKFLMESDRNAELQNLGDLSQVFGALNPWDSYYISSNGDSNAAFHYWNIALLRGYEVHYTAHRFGKMFLKNLASVNTFITNAAWDLVIYPPAIPPSLASHTDLVQSVSNSNGLKHDSTITVQYRPNAFEDIPGLQQRSIFFPYYSQSCHAVSLTEPQKLYNDVFNWLNDNGFILSR
jgi:hypothetical protein